LYEESTFAPTVDSQDLDFFDGVVGPINDLQATDRFDLDSATSSIALGGFTGLSRACLKQVQEAPQGLSFSAPERVEHLGGGRVEEERVLRRHASSSTRSLLFDFLPGNPVAGRVIVDPPGEFAPVFGIFAPQLLAKESRQLSLLLHGQRRRFFLQLNQAHTTD
jgi:hypothetical protein